MTSRRKFLKQSLVASAAFGFPTILSAAHFSALSKRIGPNDQINIGLIGAKGMGWANMSSFLKMAQVNCRAIADIDENVLQERAQEVEKLRGKKPKLYGDYRKMLEDKDLDAIIIGTPDHWHCLQLMDSLEAGKHVYVEKPLANTIEECNLMVKGQKRYEKLVQVGQWQRSGSQYGP